MTFDVPAWGAWDGPNEDEDYGGDHELEDDNKSPVPLVEGLCVLGRGVGDPEADEGANRIEQLPEGHNFASNLRRSELADVYGPRC